MLPRGFYKSNKMRFNGKSDLAARYRQ